MSSPVLSLDALLGEIRAALKLPHWLQDETLHSHHDEPAHIISSKDVQTSRYDASCCLSASLDSKASMERDHFALERSSNGRKSWRWSVEVHTGAAWQLVMSTIELAKAILAFASVKTMHPMRVRVVFFEPLPSKSRGHHHDVKNHIGISLAELLRAGPATSQTGKEVKLTSTVPAVNPSQLERGNALHNEECAPETTASSQPSDGAALHAPKSLHIPALKLPPALPNKFDESTGIMYTPLTSVDGVQHAQSQPSRCLPPSPRPCESPLALVHGLVDSRKHFANNSESSASIQSFTTAHTDGSDVSVLNHGFQLSGCTMQSAPHSARATLKAREERIVYHRAAGHKKRLSAAASSDNPNVTKLTFTPLQLPLASTLSKLHDSSAAERSFDGSKNRDQPRSPRAAVAFFGRQSSPHKSSLPSATPIITGKTRADLFSVTAEQITSRAANLSGTVRHVHSFQHSATESATAQSVSPGADKRKLPIHSDEDADTQRSSLSPRSDISLSEAIAGHRRIFALGVRKESLLAAIDPGTNPATNELMQISRVQRQAGRSSNSHRFAGAKAPRTHVPPAKPTQPYSSASGLSDTRENLSFVRFVDRASQSLPADARGFGVSQAMLKGTRLPRAQAHAHTRMRSGFGRVKFSDKKTRVQISTIP